MTTQILTILRTNGTTETADLSANGSRRGVALIERCRLLIDAQYLDIINLRNGRVMLVDDGGHGKGLPENKKATALYHAVCRPGTTHRIVGDAVIARDDWFGGE